MTNSDNIVISRDELPSEDAARGFLNMHDGFDEPVSSKHFYDVALYYLRLAEIQKNKGL